MNELLPGVREMYERHEDWELRERVRKDLTIPPIDLYAMAINALILRNELQDTSEFRVCDVGCGTGRGTQMVSRLLPHAMVYACDINTNSYQFSKGGALVEVREGPAEKLPWYVGREFDVIFSINSIYYWKEAALARIRQALKQGGVFVVGTVTPNTKPYERILKNRIAAAAGLPTPPMWTDRFTTFNGPQLLADNGFVIESIQERHSILEVPEPARPTYLAALETAHTFYEEPPLSLTDGRPVAGEELKQRWTAAVDAVGPKFMDEVIARHEAEGYRGDYVDYSGAGIVICK